MVYRYNPQSGKMEEFHSMFDPKYIEVFGQTAPRTPTPYTPYYPWVGVDKVKFPNTWNILVKFFYSGEWHQITRYKYEGSNYSNAGYFAGSI